MHRRVGDDAVAPVGLGFAGFKLRFDQRDDFAVRPNKATAAGRIFRSEMNEQSIDRQVGGSEWLGKLRGGEVAGVGFFHDHDPAVLAEFPGELALADVHGKNLGRAVLEQAIGETAGGSAEVDGGESGHVQLEMAEGVFQLVAAAADVFFGGRQCQRVIRLDGIAGFVGALGVDADLSGEDGAFGAFTAFAKAAFHQCLVEASH